jgi:Beta-carotene isomerase D27-like, C-terminal
MNAWATRVGGTFLMGECEVNDVEFEDGTLGRDQGLLVKRCRFLEESGCASVCVNSCKIPTQRFFLEDMGLPLTMTPDYDTHECQFSFGVIPSEGGEQEARNTPCLSRCPTSGAMRQRHSEGMRVAASLSAGESETGKDADDNNQATSLCAFMDN